MATLTQQIKARRRKFVKDLGGKVLWKLEKKMSDFSTIPVTPFLDTNEFEWTRKLEDNWKLIRQEADEVLKFKELIPSLQDISKDQTSVNTDNNWKTYFFYGFGYKAGGNCLRCPLTTKFLEEIPGMVTAFFSILNPGKHIPEHRGVYKGIVRYHLGLKVPETSQNCRIRVDNTFNHWEEGKGMLFDDTYNHEVWNDTNEVRVILLIDVIRPMRFPGNVFNKALINLVKKTDYVQDARKNQQAWEEKFANETP